VSVERHRRPTFKAKVARPFEDLVNLDRIVGLRRRGVRIRGCRYELVEQGHCHAGPYIAVEAQPRTYALLRSRTVLIDDSSTRLRAVTR